MVLIFTLEPLQALLKVVEKQVHKEIKAKSVLKVNKVL
jgi:hypothetical protein